MTSYPKRKGTVMFPTSHDITPFNLEASTKFLKLMLESGNQVLIVSKPRLTCIVHLLAELHDYQEQILFRFTIGTMASATSLLWEPGAPEPLERLSSLRMARLSGFRTSVSMEPLLGCFNTALLVLEETRPYVTDTVWIRKMNQIRRRVDMTDSTIAKAVRDIEVSQSDEEMMRLYNELAGDPVVRWKESIKKVVERCTDAG